MPSPTLSPMGHGFAGGGFEFSDELGDETAEDLALRAPITADDLDETYPHRFRDRKHYALHPNRHGVSPCFIRHVIALIVHVNIPEAFVFMSSQSLHNRTLSRTIVSRAPASYISELASSQTSPVTGHRAACLTRPV